MQKFKIQNRNRLQKLVRAFPQLKTISDAEKPILVEITEEDCKLGVPSDQTNCAAARACRREYKADGVYIGIGTSYIIKGTHAVRYITGDALGREITAFDRNGGKRRSGFQPGMYQLSAPSTRLGEPHDGHKNEGEGPARPRTQKPLVRHVTAQVRH